MNALISILLGLFVLAFIVLLFVIGINFPPLGAILLLLLVAAVVLMIAYMIGTIIREGL